MIAHDTVNNTTTKKVQQHCTSYRIRIVRGRLSCVFFFFFLSFSLSRCDTRWWDNFSKPPHWRSSKVKCGSKINFLTLSTIFQSVTIYVNAKLQFSYRYTSRSRVFCDKSFLHVTKLPVSFNFLHNLRNVRCKGYIRISLDIVQHTRLKIPIEFYSFLRKWQSYLIALPVKASFW